MKTRLSALVAALAMAGAVLPAVAATAASCTISGTRGDDLLHGTPAADVICGGGGDDVVYGRGGADTLIGGAGSDQLLGGAGGDAAVGGSGADTLKGGAGLDDLVGSAGTDRLLGGLDADDLVGGAGGDVLEGAIGNDTLLGGIGDDVLHGGDGDDTLDGEDGSDILDGGAGRDGCSQDENDEQQNCEDVTAPQLADFAIEPSSIDTSKDAQTIMIRAHITDDLSGLSDGYGGPEYSYSTVLLRGPEGSLAHLYAEFRPGSVDPDRNLISGTAQDGVYESHVTLPAYSAQGTWWVQYVSLKDEAHNERYLWPEDLHDAGFRTTFEQTGAGDMRGPTISAIDVTPATVDTSSDAARITVTADVDDDMSGFVWGLLSFDSATERQHLYIALQQSGGVYEGSADLPRYAERGTWTLSSVSLRDRAGNSTGLSKADLTDRGLARSFEQVGDDDTTTPSVVEFDFTPKQVDTSQQAASITFTTRLADVTAGIHEATVSFWAPGDACSNESCPSGRQTLRTRFTALERISGTAHDGIYQATAVLPQYSELGTWKIHWFAVRDVAGNELFLIEDNEDTTFMGGRHGEVSALGFPTSFTNGT